MTPKDVIDHLRATEQARLAEAYKLPCSHKGILASNSYLCALEDVERELAVAVPPDPHPETATLGWEAFCREHQQKVDDLCPRCEIQRLEQERDEAEARCCPEDMGFEEYIGVLHRRILELTNGQARPEVDSAWVPPTSAPRTDGYATDASVLSEGLTSVSLPDPAAPLEQTISRTSSGAPE